MHPLITKLRGLSMSRSRTPRKTYLFAKPLSVLKNKNVRFYMFITSFSSTYFYSLYLSKNSENEVLRIGAAGSITVFLAESSFYFIDAINTWSKVITTENLGIHQMAAKILREEGIYGLYRGYSSCFYSSILYGYVYFFVYKGLKVLFKERL